MTLKMWILLLTSLCVAVTSLKCTVTNKDNVTETPDVVSFLWSKKVENGTFDANWSTGFYIHSAAAKFVGTRLAVFRLTIYISLDG